MLASNLIGHISAKWILIATVWFFPILTEEAAHAQSAADKEKILEGLCACQITYEEATLFMGVALFENVKVQFTLPAGAKIVFDSIGIGYEEKEEEKEGEEEGKKNKTIVLTAQTSKLWIESGFFPRDVGERISVRFDDISFGTISTPYFKSFFERTGASFTFNWVLYYDESNFSINLKLDGVRSPDQFSIVLDGEVNEDKRSFPRNHVEDSVYELAFADSQINSGTVLYVEHRTMDQVVTGMRNTGNYDRFFSTLSGLKKAVPLSPLAAKDKKSLNDLRVFLENWSSTDHALKIEIRGRKTEDIFSALLNSIQIIDPAMLSSDSGSEMSPDNLVNTSIAMMDAIGQSKKNVSVTTGFEYLEKYSDED